MAELFVRLFFRPILFFELIIISFFINLLALAPTLYVIQLFNRYLSHGVKGTLTTLTAGVLIAILLEVIFRWLRQHIAAAVSARPNRRLCQAAFYAMLGVKNAVITSMSTSTKQEMLRGINKIQDAYSASNIITFLDLPFSFLIILVLYLLSPPLALIALIGLISAIFTGLIGQLFIRRPARFLMTSAINQGSLINAVSQLSDLVRAFNGQQFFARLWKAELFTSHVLKHKVANRGAAMQILTAMLSSLLTIAIISTGAMQVVEGSLTIGALIGANILAARALMPAIRFISLAPQLTESKQALKRLKELSRMPQESQEKATLTKFKGQLELKDLAFIYPGLPAPLFESLSLKLTPGITLAVIGTNGSGKTTLARVLSGLIEPNRGQVLADEVALTQLSHEWWKRQIIYLPQEAMFFSGSIRENILMNNPDLPSKTINRILKKADLKNYIDTSPKGLGTMVQQNGQTLSLGIRRRLAIARSLVADGRLVIFDEPTEGLDIPGQQAVYQLLNEFQQDGKTIIIFSHDHNILKGAHIVMDMSTKPTPKISRVLRSPSKEAVEDENKSNKGKKKI